MSMGEFNELVCKGLKAELQPRSKKFIWLRWPGIRSNGAIYFSCFDV